MKSTIAILGLAFAFANAEAATNKLSANKLSTTKSTTTRSVSSSASSNSTQVVAPGYDSKVQSPVSLTPSVGMTYSKMHGLRELKTSDQNGLSLNALVDLKLGRGFYLQTGAMYNQMGTKIGDVNEGNTSLKGVRFNLTYLYVPAIAKLNVYGSNGNTVFLKGGLAAGVIVNKEFQGNVNGLTASSSSIPVFEIKQYDLPVILGVGGRFPIDRVFALTADASWMRSTFSISGSDNVYNEGFALTGGLNIPL